jgi:MFS transporter, PPP family, 3-phenylpropionic acid transporter
MRLPAPLALSLFYLTSFAVLGVYLPYFNLYLKGAGFSGPQIGIVSALLPLCSAIVPTVSGVLADRAGRRRGLVVLSSLLALLTFSLTLGARSFLSVALVIGLFAALRAPALPLVEATAMEISEAGGPHYGRMRAWGSVAFIVLAVGAGRAVGLWGERSILYIILGLLALNLLSAPLLPRDAVRTAGRGSARGLASLVLSRPVLPFLAACVLSQASHGPYYVFYSIHLEEVGYRPQAIGALWGLAVTCEVVAMLRMPAVLRRFGTLPIMAACLLLSSVRWWICAVSAHPLAMAAAQLLHAATFAAFHVAAVTHTHRLFGEDRTASGQAIYGSATYGVGNIVGMSASGLLSDRMTYPGLFAIAAWVALLGGFLVLATARRENRRSQGVE